MDNNTSQENIRYINQEQPKIPVKLPMEFNNYPMPKRSETMAEKNLGPEDFPIKKFKYIDTKRTFSLSNYNLDIEGACPRKYGVFHQKKHYGLTNLDIEKSSPSPLYKFINKKDFTNTNKDIEGTIPRGHHSIVTNRHLDPLCPKYDFPGYKEKFPAPETDMKFIRDSIDVKDIPGAQSNCGRKMHIQTRNLLDKFRRERDDELFVSHRKLYKGNKESDSLNFKDVYGAKEFSKRRTNPLDPRYKLDDVEGKKVVDYADIDGSHPVVFSKFNFSKVNKGNNTDDIVGAQPDTKSAFAKFKIKHKRPLKYISEDIIGAHSGTLKKGIITKRCLNPLTPKIPIFGLERGVFRDWI